MRHCLPPTQNDEAQSGRSSLLHCCSQQFTFFASQSRLVLPKQIAGDLKDKEGGLLCGSEVLWLTSHCGDSGNLAKFPPLSSQLASAMV